MEQNQANHRYGQLYIESQVKEAEKQREDQLLCVTDIFRGYENKISNQLSGIQSGVGNVQDGVSKMQYGFNRFMQTEELDKISSWLSKIHPKSHYKPIQENRVADSGM